MQTERQHLPRIEMAGRKKHCCSSYRHVIMYCVRTCDLPRNFTHNFMQHVAMPPVCNTINKTWNGYYISYHTPNGEQKKKNEFLPRKIKYQSKWQWNEAHDTHSLLCWHLYFYAGDTFVILLISPIQTPQFILATHLPSSYRVCESSD